MVWGRCPEHVLSEKGIDTPEDKMTTQNISTYFAGIFGFRGSTMQMCPPDLHRLHVFSPFGNSHFIYSNWNGMKSDREDIRFGVPQPRVVGSEESPIGAENGY